MRTPFQPAPEAGPGGLPAAPPSLAPPTFTPQPRYVPGAPGGAGTSVQGGPSQVPAQGGPPPEERIPGLPDTPVEPGPPAAPPASASPSAGARVGWAMVPRVNLLPEEITNRRRFHRVQRVLAGIIALVVVLCGLVAVWERSKVSQARAELALTKSETLELGRQQSAYAEAPKLAAELDAARAAREQALGTDILWFRFLTDLAVNTPTDAALSSVTVEMSGGSAASQASSATPFVPTGLGTVKVVGEAGRFTDVASWLDSAGKVNGLGGTLLESAALASAAGGSGGLPISYSGSAVVTKAALSHRYDRKAD
jgi:hypothetical protein